MQFFNTTVTPQAIALANRTMETTFLSEGAVVREFERQLERQFSLHNVVAVNSGTSALHLALLAANVKPGDEVITTAQTFIATALAILYCGATPVFADIDPCTGNLKPESVKSKVTDKTRAVLGVHWAGYPMEMREIYTDTCRPNIELIEDAAHALGATHDGIPIGSYRYSDMTCFSFQAIKHLTTGDGGAISCKWKVDYNLLRRLRWFGIDRENDKPDELGERQYTLQSVGYKYHLNDYAASLGLGNLVGFHERLVRRREIAALYFAHLSHVSGLQLMKYQLQHESSYWLFPVLVARRLDFVRAMKAKGIPTSTVHRRIDRHPIFGGLRNDLPGLEYFDEHQIHLPIHENLTDDDVWHVINTIKEGW